MRDLLQFLYNNNIRCFNAIAKSMTDKTCVGFNCGAPSVIRKSHSVQIVRDFITANGLPCQVEDTTNSAHFKIIIL